MLTSRIRSTGSLDVQKKKSMAKYVCIIVNPPILLSGFLIN